MRIALVVHDYSRTVGHGRYVAELADRFRHEHDVHVFANRADPAPAGVRVHHVPALRTNALATILTFAPGAALAMRERFDVVHTQGLAAVSGDVVTAHICLATWFAALRRVDAALGWKQRLFEGVTIPLERAFYRANRDAWVIAISDALRADLAREYGVSRHVEVIPHGVDTAVFSPAGRERWRTTVRASLGIAEGVPLALYVGDLRRGAAVAFESIARAPGVHLALVSRSEVAPYRALAERLGVGDRVRFVPPTDTVERHYAAADLFLFPTVYDTFGMVIAEAMASGLPVVTTRRAGAAELIDDGASGLLVDSPEDVEGLARHVRALAGDSALRSRIGGAARARAERQGWDAVATQTLAVYERARAARESGRTRVLPVAHGA